jgi:hypothetical protein
MRVIHLIAPLSRLALANLSSLSPLPVYQGVYRELSVKIVLLMAGRFFKKNYKLQTVRCLHADLPLQPCCEITGALSRRKQGVVEGK